MDIPIENQFETKFRYVGVIGDKQWFLKQNLIPNTLYNNEQLKKCLPIFSKLKEELECLDFILDIEKYNIYIFLPYPYASSQITLNNQNFNSFIHKLDKAYTNALTLLFVCSSEVWINYKAEAFVSFLRHLCKATEIKKKNRELQFKPPFMHFILTLDRYIEVNNDNHDNSIKEEIDSFRSTILNLLRSNRIIPKPDQNDIRNSLAQLPLDLVETRINYIKSPKLYSFDQEKTDVDDWGENNKKLLSEDFDLNFDLDSKTNSNEFIIPKDSQKSLFLSLWLERIYLILKKL
ncbi:hypothetical protein K502DRAFT_349911 [Neoconidiobolus thromboides FSU 785]|nr:hypothetical protein K502DRAFT_349911 [Neoconidiobolus thromboides FSU 785]